MPARLNHHIVAASHPTIRHRIADRRCTWRFAVV